MSESRARHSSRALIMHVAAMAVAFGIAAASAAAHPPHGLVVDPTGGVWFSDLRRIWRVTPDQELEQMRPAGERHTHELALDRAGNVHGEDSYYDPATQTYRAALWRISPVGRFEFILEPTARPPLGLSIWRDAQDRTYFADRVIGDDTATLLVRRDASGGVDVLLGPKSALRRAGYPQVLSNVGGSAFDAEGAFVFRNGAVLRKASPDGVVVVLRRDLPDENFGIAAEAPGSILVAHFGGARILRFARAAREVVDTSERPWRPTGVAARGGAIYVLEADQDQRGVTKHLRVRRLSDRPAILATVPVD